MTTVSPHFPITTSQRLKLPLNGTIYTTQRKVAAEKQLPSVGDFMTGELGTAWADSRIVDTNIGPDASKGVLSIVHARIPTVTEQLASNWEHTKIPVGIGQFEGVVRTFIIPAEAYADDSPALNTAMPVIAGGLFDGDGYVLYEREAMRSGTPLEPVFRVERRTYVRKIPQYKHDTDPTYGNNLLTIQTLCHKNENAPGVEDSEITIAALFTDQDHAFWGLQSDGTVREGEQLTPDWYVITTRQIIPASLLGVGRSYTTAIDYAWPAVLSDIQVDIWDRKDGGVQMYPRPVYSKEAYRGPCKAVIEESWSIAAPTPDEPNVMRPMPVDFSSPFWGLNIAPCLHDDLSIVINSGTEHPIYKYTVGTYEFGATEPDTWPASILASDEPRPFRGGYLRTRITVYPPAYTAPTLPP